MPKLILWVLEQLKSLAFWLAKKLKKSRSWCFASAVRLVYRERRRQREGEADEFMQKMYVEGIGTLVVPAIRFSSVDEFKDLAKVCVGGTAPLFEAVADSISNVDNRFLRFLNRRAREGENLYFDVFLNEKEALK